MPSRAVPARRCPVSKGGWAASSPNRHGMPAPQCTCFAVLPQYVHTRGWPLLDRALQRARPNASGSRAAAARPSCSCLAAPSRMHPGLWAGTGVASGRSSGGGHVPPKTCTLLQKSYGPRPRVRCSARTMGLLRFKGRRLCFRERERGCSWLKENRFWNVASS